MAACKFFAQGRCMYGAACRNSHEAAASGSSAALPSWQRPQTLVSSPGTRSIPPTNISTVPKTICRYFTEGKCTFGANCKNSHDASLVGFSSAQSSIVVPGMDLRLAISAMKTGTAVTAEEVSGLNLSYVPCKFFLRGFCRNGDACKFQHTSLEKLEDGQPRNQAAPEYPNISAEKKVDKGFVSQCISRDIHGSIVKFQAGAEITSVKLVSDFSAVQITGLVTNIEPAFVSDMLIALGFTVPTSNIVLKQLAGVGTVAEVKVEDPSFARMLTQKYGELQETGVENGISIRPVSEGGYGTLVNRLQLSKVNCTWYEGSRSAWLLFASRKSAFQASRRLEASTILGRALSCSVQESYRGYHITGDTTLQINNLHPETSWGDLSSILRGHVEPSKITLGDPTHKFFGDKAAAVVEKLLRNIGDLESFHAQTVEGTSKMKGTATFFEREKATFAVQTLHNTKIASLGNSKLLISHVVSVKYNVSAAIAEALKGELEELRQTVWRKGNIQLKSYPQTNLLKPFTTLRLFGETAKNVADAKAALENLLAGTRVMVEDTPLWDPYFLTPGGLADLNEISASYKLFIYRDARKSQLLLYGGSATTQTEIQQILASKVDTLHKLAHTIVLTTDLLKSAMKGGMRRLKARFGDAVGLNISANPKSITITGSTEDLHEARALLINPAQYPTESTSTTQTGDCVVCWTEATTALNTACGHVYCNDCFESQVASASDRDFPIHCEGAESQCQHIFSLEELKTMLSSTAFENLLRASFDVYIRTRPKEFQHCPSPDCPQVYRLTKTRDTFLCSMCFTSVCTTCNVLYHDGMTCEEYKDISSEGTKAFQKWTKENDARPCPNCKILIEKAEGCNHMACSRCGTHICWECMNIYDTSEECYGHMQKVHGRYGA